MYLILKNNVMIDFLVLMTSGVWTFIGLFVLIYVVLWYMLAFWTRFWKTFNIQKHGWPPVDCNDDDAEINTTQKK